MDQLLHLPLEQYQERYTENLVDWEESIFKNYFNYSRARSYEHTTMPVNIHVGEVLDAISRPQFALGQILRILSNPPIRQSRIYCSDFYTPGLDALAYSRKNYRISSFLWAQTFDQYDFTNQFSWMRPYEVMAFDIYEHVFVASELLKELIVAALPYAESKIHVVGLPYNSKRVEGDWDETFLPSEKFDVLYSSRWDVEKNPGMFLDLVEAREDLKFVICTGSPELRGTDTVALERVMTITDKGKNLSVYPGLTKTQYHSILAGSKIQFNCAFQDWISFTLLDALTFGCAPLYPNFRSFPEALNYSSDNLYSPDSVSDALDKLERLLTAPKFDYREKVLDYHNGTLDRIANILQK